jgi:hypothetical protein
MCMSEEGLPDPSEPVTSDSEEKEEQTSGGVTEVEQTGDDPNDPDSYTHTHYPDNPFGT